MTWGFVALAGATVASGVMAGEAADSAASASVEAGRIQADSAQKGVDEVRRQFDAITSLLKPYTAAGPQALSGIQDMLGLNGAEAQSAALALVRRDYQVFAQMDPPAHTEERKLMAPEFSVARVEELRPKVQAHINALAQALGRAPHIGLHAGHSGRAIELGYEVLLFVYRAITRQNVADKRATCVELIVSSTAQFDAFD